MGIVLRRRGGGARSLLYLREYGNLDVSVRDSHEACQTGI
jgi:hypothetical protein